MWGLLGLVFAGILGVGSTFQGVSDELANGVVVALMLTSLLLNCTVSLLIALRIRWYQKILRTSLGKEHGKIYTRIIVLCVESCAMIAVVEAVHVALALIATENDGRLSLQVTFFLLPHICVSEILRETFTLLK